MKVQKFGIELRKIGNVHALYEDADRVLEMNNFEVIQTKTIAHSLQHMIKVQNYFDVCTIKKCQKISQVHIPLENLEIYSAMHCIHWSEMTTDYRQVLVAMILNDFRSVLNPL